MFDVDGTMCRAVRQAAKEAQTNNTFSNSEHAGDTVAITPDRLSLRPRLQLHGPCQCGFARRLTDCKRLKTKKQRTAHHGRGRQSRQRCDVRRHGVSYHGGAFSAGAGYLNARNPNVSFYGNTPNKGPATSNNIGSPGSATAPQALPAYSGYASANTLQISGPGASYVLSQTTISAVVTNTRFEGLGSASGPGTMGVAAPEISEGTVLIHLK